MSRCLLSRHRRKLFVQHLRNSNCSSYRARRGCWCPFCVASREVPTYGVLRRQKSEQVYLHPSSPLPNLVFLRWPRRWFTRRYLSLLSNRRVTAYTTSPAMYLYLTQAQPLAPWRDPFSPILRPRQAFQPRNYPLQTSFCRVWTLPFDSSRPRTVSRLSPASCRFAVDTVYRSLNTETDTFALRVRATYRRERVPKRP